MTLVELVGQIEGIARNARIEIKHEQSDGNQDCRGGQDDPRCQSGEARHLPSDDCARKYPEHRGVVRARVGEDGKAERPGGRVRIALLENDARQPAQQERSTNGRDCAPPVRIHPIGQNADSQSHQQCADERKRGRGPTLEHPADRGAHEPGTEPNADPWLLKETLAESQHQPLQRRIFRGVGGLLDHVERFKVLPEGMRRVCETARRVRIARQQITEFVVNSRHRNVQYGKQRRTDADGEQEHGQASEKGPFGERHR